MNYANTTNASQITPRIIQCRNSQALEVSGAAGIAIAAAPNTGAPATAAVDTSVTQDVVISGQLGNAAETVTLESYLSGAGLRRLTPTRRRA
jgi:hypothetical protein